MNYYITYTRLNTTGQIVISWMACKTEHDLDTTEGLLAFIKQMKYSKGPDVLIINWKQLDKGTT